MEFLSTAIIRVNGALRQMMGDRWRFYHAIVAIVLGIAAFSAFQAILAYEPDQRSGAERIMGDDYYDADAAPQPILTPNSHRDVFEVDEVQQFTG